MAKTSVSGSAPSKAVTLTRREIEVLRLLLESKSSTEIAEALRCSKRTVDFHLVNIYDKLQVSNRVQAAERVSKLGLVDSMGRINAPVSDWEQMERECEAA